MEPGDDGPDALDVWDRLEVEMGVLIAMLEDTDPADRARLRQIRADLAELAARLGAFGIIPAAPGAWN